MTDDELFVWVMHRFSEVFEDHAIIKGGIALRLLDSPRSTTDIDYVFVPYTSKKQILPRFEDVLYEIENADVKLRIHSKMIRADVRVENTAIQIEANVMPECASIPMATGALARSTGVPSQVVRIMQPGVALAHKLAAWNERRLLRDLYDCYFLFGRAKAKPDLDVLDQRLVRVESRLPLLRKKKQMTRAEFASALRHAISVLSEETVQDELGVLLMPEERVGLGPRIKVVLSALVEELEKLP